MTIKKKITLKKFEKTLNETGNLSQACLKLGLADSNPRYYINKKGWRLVQSFKIEKLKNPEPKRHKKKQELNIEYITEALQEKMNVEELSQKCHYASVNSFKSALLARGYQLKKHYQLTRG